MRYCPDNDIIRLVAGDGAPRIAFQLINAATGAPIDISASTKTVKVRPDATGTPLERTVIDKLAALGELAVAFGLGMEPLQLMTAAALAASMAFMLPVATPPNAIVFGSGYLTIPQMSRAGIVLNLVAIVLITTLGSVLIPLFLS